VYDTIASLQKSSMMHSYGYKTLD